MTIAVPVIIWRFRMAALIKYGGLESVSNNKMWKLGSVIKLVGLSFRREQKTTTLVCDDYQKFNSSI